MATTTWTPAPEYGRTTPQKWRLQDGTVVQHPQLEISASGRRVRFAGAAKSFGVNQVDQAVSAWVATEATSRGTKPWTPVSNMTFGDSASEHVHLAQTDSTGFGARNNETHVIWTYHNKDLDITAFAHVLMQTRGYNYVLTTRLFYEMTEVGSGGVSTRDQRTFRSRDPNLDNWLQAEANAPEALPDITFGMERFNSPRPLALQAWIQCRKIDELSTIYIPDFRDPQQPGWIALERTESSYTSEIDHEFGEIAQLAGPSKRLKKALDNLIGEMRREGYVVADLPEDVRDLAAGNVTRFELTISADTTTGPDRRHVVYFDPATGTVSVACSHNVESTAALQAYENAKFMADLKGEGDELLTYVQAYRDQKAEEDALKVIDERAATMKELVSHIGPPATTGGTTTAPSPRRDTA